MKTYAGQAKRLERAITVAFYRLIEGLGLERRPGREGVERIDRFLQRLGVVYLAVAAVVAVVWLLGEAM